MKTRIAALLLAAACYPIMGVAIAEAQALPVTKAFRLEHSDPAASAETLRQLYPQVLTVVEAAGKSLIVRGSAQNLDEVEAVLKAIDVPGATNATPKTATDPNDTSLKGATGSGVRVDLSRSMRQSSADSSLAKLQNDYRSHEQQAQQLASQARVAAQQPVQAALGMDPAASGSRAKDGASPQATPQLREQVTKAFEARQQLLRVELEQFRQRLARIEQTLEAREQLKQTIIDQRIKQLLNPALEWEPAVQVPSDTTKPATTRAPVGVAPTAPVAVAAPTARMPTPIDISRNPDQPTTSTTTAPEKPTRQVVMLRERVKLAMDQLLKGGATIDEAIHDVKALTEAEELIDIGAPAFRLEQLERWQNLKRIAVDLAKRGSLAPAKSLEVQKAVDEAIDHANQQFMQRLPQFLKSPRELERELAEANEALGRAQELPDAESKELEAAKKRLHFVKAQSANQLDLVTVRLRHAILELERLQLGVSEIAGPDAEKQKMLVAAASRRVSQWAGLSNLYRQAAGQGARMVSLGSDRKSDDEAQGIADAQLWRRVGLELRPGGSGFDQQRGLLVTGVKDASPADKTGLRIRDMVLGVNGVETLSAADVSYLIGEIPSLSVASLHILRDGKRLTEVIVELADSPDPAVGAMSGAAGTKAPGSKSKTSDSDNQVPDIKPSSEVPPKKSPSKDVPAIQVPATKPAPKEDAQAGPTAQPNELVEAVRERANVLVHLLQEGKARMEDAVRASIDLDVEEWDSDFDLPALRKQRLDRWLRLKDIADDLHKQGKISQSELAGVDAGVRRASNPPKREAGDWRILLESPAELQRRIDATANTVRLMQSQADVIKEALQRAKPGERMVELQALLDRALNELKDAKQRLTVAREANAAQIEIVRGRLSLAAERMKVWFMHHISDSAAGVKERLDKAAYARVEQLQTLLRILEETNVRGDASSRNIPDSTAEDLWSSLGAQLSPVGSDRVASFPLHGGLAVTEVREDGPMGRSGFRKGDLLVGAGGWETLSVGDALFAFHHARPADGKVEFHILRDDKLLSTKVALSTFR